MFNLKIMSAACGSCEFDNHKGKIYFIMINSTHLSILYFNFNELCTCPGSLKTSEVGLGAA